VQRVISLCPSYTETVHDLGAWELLVGRTRYCVHPKERVGDVPHVRGTKDPDLERIVALRPDLVLASREENRREDVEALRARGVEVHVSQPDSPAEAADFVQQLGVLLGREAAGVELAGAMREALSALRQVTAAGRTLQVGYLIWREPWMAAGDQTYIGRLLAEAGLAVTSAGRYPEVDVAGLAQVDAVLLSSEPFPFGQKHRAELAVATGLPIERIHVVDGELLGWPGSRTLAGVGYVGELAERLASPDPGTAQDPDGSC
jgi:iron complex transport system substrate-binding protein